MDNATPEIPIRLRGSGETALKIDCTLDSPYEDYSLTLEPNEPSRFFSDECFGDLVSPAGANKDRLDWLSDFTEGRYLCSEDSLENSAEFLFLGTSLDEKLDIYLNGSAEFRIDTTLSKDSWDIPEIHPLKSSLMHPKDGINCTLNCNWYERVQWAYRNSVLLLGYQKSFSEFHSEEEQIILQEIGRFLHASKFGATNLLRFLLSSNMSACPADFIEISQTNHPKIYNFYRPKFKNDRVFIKDGIVYTLVLGDRGRYKKINYTMVKKVYSNDNKGKQALCDAFYCSNWIGQISIPVQCLIDYMGIRVMAEPLIPVWLDEPEDFIEKLSLQSELSDNGIGMARHDVSTIILSDKNLAKLLQSASKYLNLSSWPIPFDSSDMDLTLKGCSNPKLFKCDSILHIRNTHEVLPPLLNFNSGGDPLYLSRFRQEFCTKHYRKSLKCSVKSQTIFDGSKNGDEYEIFRAAVEYKYLLLDKCLDSCRNLMDSWDICNTFHSFGLNVRWIGIAYERTSNSGIKDVLASDMIARAVKHLWDLKLQEFFCSDSIDFVFVQKSLLKIVNDTLGLMADSQMFWYQDIFPQISKHFNVVNLDEMTPRLLPQMLLKKAIEINLGILLPSPEDGITYRSPITLDRFTSENCGSLLFGSSSDCPTHIYARAKVVRPISSLSIQKVAYSLCNSGDDYFHPLSMANSFGMGIGKNIESRLSGVGYPCDPICILNDEMVCTSYKRNYIGLNLFCLLESFLLADPIKRCKFLVAIGYEFFRHKFYSEALKYSKYVKEHAPKVSCTIISAKMLEIQCYSVKDDQKRCKILCKELFSDIKELEGVYGMLSIQLLLIMSFDAWRRREYQEGIMYINKAKEAFLYLSGLSGYGWLPVAFLSLLGYCYRELGMNLYATKTWHEVVRHCNLSQLSNFILCNQMWLLVESLLRDGSYEQGSMLSTELIPIIENEFGPLSAECLRAIYVAAWANYQVGCIHILHPYLYLSNSDKKLRQNNTYWFEDIEFVLEEFSIADSCAIKRKHRKEAILLYVLLYERLKALSKNNRDSLFEILKKLAPSSDLSFLDKVEDITLEILREHGIKREDFMLPDSDEFLDPYFEQASICQKKKLLVIKNILLLKTLALSTEQCLFIARKLYNLYACQVASERVWKLYTGSNLEDEGPSEKCTMHGQSRLKQAYLYGSKVTRFPETFKSTVLISQRNVLHRDHDLRSIEELLLKRSTMNETEICRICQIRCQEDADVQMCGPDAWFDSIFEFINPNDTSNDGKFLLFLDILRNFLTHSKRLVILGHIANISNSKLKQTVTFNIFRDKMMDIMKKSIS